MLDIESQSNDAIVLRHREIVFGRLRCFETVPGAVHATVGKFCLVLDEDLTPKLTELVGLPVAVMRWGGKDRIIPWHGWS